MKLFLDKKYTHKDLVIIILAMFYFLLNMQSLSITGFSDLEGEGSSLKLYHVFSIVFMPILLTSRIIIPSITTISFFVIAITNSMLAVFFLYPINNLIVNYLFAFYMVVLGSYAYVIAKEKLLKMLQNVSIFILFMVIVKMGIYYKIIFDYLKNPYAHPVIPFFYGGGPNLEATWLALASLFFLKKKSFYIYSGIVLGVSAVYASRVGMIVIVLVMLYRWFSKNSSIKERVLLSGLMLFTPILVLFFNPYLIDRFISIGEDPGSTGRLAMWKYLFNSFIDSPFIGHGAGNAINSIESISNINFIEDNVHNYFAQTLLDFGIFGFIVYVFILGRIFFKESVNGFRNPYAAFVLVFGTISFIQFRGAEPLFWFVYGIYEASSLKNMQRRSLNEGAGGINSSI